MTRPRIYALLALCGLLASALAPCIWDYDTLNQERSRFPSALELITGEFPRHSAAYYRWRIEDRSTRLKAGEDDPQLYDDLAVAHSKLGDNEKAIEWMDTKEVKHPGMYETQANIGTFHLHAGNLDQGIEHIARAIEINPEAHFGREIYQELLARYILEQRGGADFTTLPLQVAAISPLGKSTRGYWDFVLEQRNIAKDGIEEELERAVRGVTGMLRFGNHDSPILLEILSDLMLVDRAKDAKRLAARALLKASYEVDSEASRGAYREKARVALQTQTPSPSEDENITLEQVEATFADELADADHWWAGLEARERFWIENGADVDGRFADKYFTTKSPVLDEGRERYVTVNNYGLFTACVLIVVGLIYLVTLVRKKA